MRPALLLYGGTRALGLLILTIGSAIAGKSALKLLDGRWDSLWYRDIAEHGYGFAIATADGRVHSSYAFFPLLPWLERLLSWATPLTTGGAGLAVAWIASLCAAWGLFAIGSLLYSARVGTILAVLWGVLPVAIVQSMAYTESLFTALCVWSLYFVLRSRWVPAGVLACLAGLTRPSALALVLALFVTALVAIVRTRRFPSWPVVIGLVLAPLGWLGYVLFVASRTGSLLGYFDVQANWGNGFDGGRGLVLFIAGLPWFAALGVIVALLFVFFLVYLAVRQKQPLALIVFATAIVVLALVGSGYFSSRPRLLMPAFPLLLALAIPMARLRLRWIASILGVLALGSGVYGALMLLGSGPP